MAHPRRIVPGQTYLITRRCSQRAFRLRPCAETNRIFMYCLAFALQRTGVRLHAACVMSNHHHIVVTDPHGVLPDFLRELHRLTAKAMNASQGQWENLWAAEPCNIVRLVTDGDIEEKIAYVAANPVAAGLVQEPDEWPGFLAWREGVRRVARPKSYFREDGTCPREIELVVERPPPCHGDGPTEREWRERISRAVRTKVAAARRTIRAGGRDFLTKATVLSSSLAQHARSSETRFDVVPTFAARVSSVRERLRRIEQQFRVRYRVALERWRSGWRDVVFPRGTWGMAVFHGAQVEVDPLSS
jgi:putative transposase